MVSGSVRVTVGSSRQLKGSVQEADISIFLVFAPRAYLCSTHADLSYK